MSSFQFQPSVDITSYDWRVEPFPSKLYQLLEDVHEAGMEGIISWSPDGQSVVVHNPKAFTATFMPLYFRQSKYKSFQKQMNLYSFVRSPRNNVLGVYSHPLFRRGYKDNCDLIFRKRTTWNRNPKQMSQTSNTMTSPSTRTVSPHPEVPQSSSSVSLPKVHKPLVCTSSPTSVAKWDETVAVPRIVSIPRIVSAGSKIHSGDHDIRSNPFLRSVLFKPLPFPSPASEESATEEDSLLFDDPIPLDNERRGSVDSHLSSGFVLAMEDIIGSFDSEGYQGIGDDISIGTIDGL